MINKFNNNNFNEIYWHDSRLICINFNQTEHSNIILLMDIVIESHPNIDSNSLNDYTLIMQPALVKFLYVTEAKFNLNWDGGKIIEPTLAYIERKKSNFTNKIDETVFYNYLIEFRDEGNINLINVPSFEMIMLDKPIVYTGEDDYISRRNDVLKNNFDIIWNFRI